MSRRSRAENPSVPESPEGHTPSLVVEERDFENYLIGDSMGVGWASYRVLGDGLV